MPSTRRRTLKLASAGLASLAGCTGMFGDRERWTFQTGHDDVGPPQIIRGGPVIQSGTVYLGGNDWRVYALDAATGAEQWQFKTGGHIWTPPTLHDQTLFVTSNTRNEVHALSVKSGKQRWMTILADLGYMTSRPTVADGRLFVGSDERLHALDAATGTEHWRYAAPPAFLSWGTPLVVDDRVFVTGTRGRLHALDASTGSVAWRFTTSENIPGSPVYDAGTIYFGTEEGSVYAVHATDGTEQWQASLAGGLRMTSPTAQGGVVYAGTTAEKVYALDAASGAIKRQFETAESVRTTPVVSDGVLFVGTKGVRGGRLYAWDLQTDERRWTHELDAAIYATPAVTEKMVYVGTLAGVLHALAR